MSKVLEKLEKKMKKKQKKPTSRRPLLEAILSRPRPLLELLARQQDFNFAIKTGVVKPIKKPKLKEEVTYVI